MPTLSLLNEAIPIAGYHQPVREALDMDAYRDLSIQINVTNLSLTGSTTEGKVQLFHAARSRAGEYKQLGSDQNFSGSATELQYHTSFSRFLLATMEWNHADGGTCDLEILVVPKR